MFIFGARIMILSLIAMLVLHFFSVPLIYLHLLIILFNISFCIFGINIITNESGNASKILGISLFIIGSSFSIIFASVAIFKISMNNPFIVTLGLLFMCAVFGVMVGGLARK